LVEVAAKQISKILQVKKNTTQPSFFPTFQNNVLVRSSQVHCIYSSHSCMAVYLSAKMMISIRVEAYCSTKDQTSCIASIKCCTWEMHHYHNHQERRKEEKTDEKKT